MPVFNGERYLPRALDSLLAQSHPNLEIHISDNASTDGTRDICLSYQARDDRIRYTRIPRNEGAIANFRRVLLSARAPYFMWASHDDWWEPGFVASLLEILRTTETLGLVACEAKYCLEDGTELPFFPEGEFWRRGGLSLVTPEARIRATITHGYGNLIYGLYRTPALVGPRGTTVLDVYRGMTIFNEIPVFMQVAAGWQILVIDKILMHKRTNLATYRQAATEVNLAAIPPLASPPSSGEMRRQAQAVGRAAWVTVIAKGIRHLARVSKYHWDTFREILRALERLDVSVGAKVRLRTEAGCRLFLHLLRILLRRSKEVFPPFRRTVEKVS